MFWGFVVKKWIPQKGTCCCDKGIGQKKRKNDEVDEATRGRLNEDVAILAIETGGRMHSQFHRLITAFARFKADKIAGPLPVNRAR